MLSQNSAVQDVNERTRDIPEAVIVAGKESVGKSQLVSSLTGVQAYSANFRGSTVSCEIYKGDNFTFIDTPGIVCQSDSKTTQLALEQLHQGDKVLLVISAAHVDQDLDELLPLVRGKCGSIVVTFGDKVPAPELFRKRLDHLSIDLGVPVLLVDA